MMLRNGPDFLKNETKQLNFVCINLKDNNVLDLPYTGRPGGNILPSMGQLCTLKYEHEHY